MCSVKNDRVLPSAAALRPINNGPTASDDPPIARLFVRNRAEYLMRKTRVTVGRSSAKSAADVDVGSSTYISRNHIEIYRADSRFYVLVTGKNGLFVDGVFHRKGSAPFELQRLAILRFPSTDVTIQFHILVEDNPSASIKCQVSFMDESLIKENGRSDVLRKPSSPVGKLLFGESQVVLAPSELKQETAANCPVSVKSEEFSTKPRNRETHARESKAAVFENGVRDGSKPTYSYAQLIVQAICSQKDRQLTLSGIYNYITKKFPYYRSGDKGWQNSIRHNLSLNRYFIKVPRAQEESGKGSFWKIDPSSEAMLIEQAFKKRRQRTTQASNRTSQGESTPSLASMSSAEVDGTGTPEDSCLSWEGATFAADETKDLVIAEDVKPPPLAIFQGNGMSYETQGDQIFKDTQRHATAPSYAHHALPQFLTRPQFFIAKPSEISGALNHLPGVVPLQLPAAMVSAASTVRSNDPEQKELMGNGEIFMLPEKQLPSSIGYVPRPAQMQGFHPKTVIVRMSSSGAISGANPVGGSLVRFAFGLPALEAQTVVGLKADCEEMESEDVTTPVDDSRCVGYDTVSENRNAEMNCFPLQTIAN